MNVSFKAQVKGLPDTEEGKIMSTVFQELTKKDTKHTLVLNPNKDDLDRDVFILKTNGVKKAEYATEFDPQNCETGVKKLVKILNMLKIYEAQAVIKESKENKVNRTKEAEFLADED